MSTLQPRHWTSLLALVGLLAAGACGNDTNSSSASTAGSAAPGATTTVAKRISEPNPCVHDPGVTGTTIKIGAIIPTSGPSAQSFADILGGLKARIAKANQTGELGARKFVLDAKDDGGDVTRNTEVARQLVESDKVFAVVEGSPVANGSAQYLHDHAIPVTGWHLGLKEWSIDDNMFTFRQPAAADPQHDYSTRNNDFLKKLGATKIAVVGGMNASSATYVIQVARSVKQLGQMQVVKEITDVPVDQQDFTSIAQDIKDSGADA